MTKIFDWIKSNFLSLILLVAIVYLFGGRQGMNLSGMRTSSVGSGGFAGGSISMLAKNQMPPVFDSFEQSTAPVSSDLRMVVQDTSLSMQVKDVSEVMTGIEKLSVSMGGYMVNRSMYKPEGAATGSISIRVPVEKRADTLASIKLLGIKTVSENVSGHDVTDQYVDIQGRIDNLNKTKIKMTALQDQASRVQDLMDIQMQLNNIQSQIDSYVGQQKYLEQTAKLTRISVNLATDDLALPYSPDSAWRPAVVLKMAVRSMVGTLRLVANAVIWLVIYIPVAMVLGAVYLITKVIWRRIQSRQ